MLREEQTERNALKLASQQGERSNEMVVALDKVDFASFLHRQHSQWFLDTTLELPNYSVRVNRLLLACRSPYFRHLLGSSFFP